MAFVSGKAMEPWHARPELVIGFQNVIRVVTGDRLSTFGVLPEALFVDGTNTKYLLTRP